MTTKERSVYSMNDLILRIIIKLVLNFIIRKIFSLLKPYVFKYHHMVMTTYIHIGKYHLTIIIIWTL